MRHLQKAHPECYANHNSTGQLPSISIGVSLAPFKIEDFIEKLLTWVVVDDQVCDHTST